MKIVAKRIINNQNEEKTINDSNHNGKNYHRVHYHDLKSTQFLNSAGIVKLINVAKTWLKQGIEIKFINAKDTVKTCITRLGLDDILKFY